jgi:hypothetical protein
MTTPTEGRSAFEPSRAAPDGVPTRRRALQARHARCVLVRHLPAPTLGAADPTAEAV